LEGGRGIEWFGAEYGYGYEYEYEYGNEYEYENEYEIRAPAAIVAAGCSRLGCGPRASRPPGNAGVPPA
jgi:hypothetical protein